jgi:hypothetical protein
MNKYRIDIKYEGTKTYEYHAETIEEALEIARGGAERITNPTDEVDCVYAITKIEEVAEDK